MTVNIFPYILDDALVSSLWISTACFMLASALVAHFKELKRPLRSCLIHFELICSYIVAWIFASRSLNVTLVGFAELLLNRIFDGTTRRFLLLLFWFMCITASVVFIIFVNQMRVVTMADTTDRKFFHLTVSLVAITGLVYDPDLITLCAHLMLLIFIVIEVLRSLDIFPWSDYLNKWLLVFLDSQDSVDLILTPIFLLAGVFLPILTSRLRQSPPTVTPYYLSGVLSVGVGDGLAAVVGFKFGKVKWFRHSLIGYRLFGLNQGKGSKTIEGSLAMIFGQIFVGWALSLDVLNLSFLLFVFITTYIEAHMNCFDNIILPLIGMFIFY